MKTKVFKPGAYLRRASIVSCVVAACLRKKWRVICCAHARGQDFCERHLGKASDLIAKDAIRSVAKYSSKVRLKKLEANRQQIEQNKSEAAAQKADQQRRA